MWGEDILKWQMVYNSKPTFMDDFYSLLFAVSKTKPKPATGSSC